MEIAQGKIITYADDTVVLFHGKNWKEVEKVANIGLKEISDWLRKNLLSINISKTKFVTFTINESTQPKDNLKLKMHESTCHSGAICNCENLRATDSIKYLGVEIDKNLTWVNHIKNLSGRIRKLILVFKQLRHIMSFQSQRKIYYALAQSIITYCIPAWGSARKTHLKKLEISQRALLKVMSFKKRRYSTEDLYRDCGVLTVRQLFIKAVLIKQHMMCTKTNSDKASLKRRKDKVLKNVKAHTEFGRRSVKSLGPNLYNKFCKTLCIANVTKRECSNLVTNYLLSLSYDDTEALLQVIK